MKTFLNVSTDHIGYSFIISFWQENSFQNATAVTLVWKSAGKSEPPAVSNCCSAKLGWCRTAVLLSQLWWAIKACQTRWYALWLPWSRGEALFTVSVPIPDYTVSSQVSRFVLKGAAMLLQPVDEMQPVSVCSWNREKLRDEPATAAAGSSAQALFSH